MKTSLFATLATLALPPPAGGNIGASAMLRASSGNADYLVGELKTRVDYKMVFCLVEK